MENNYKLPVECITDKKYLYSTYIEMAFHNMFQAMNHINSKVLGRDDISTIQKTLYCKQKYIMRKTVISLFLAMSYLFGFAQNNSVLNGDLNHNGNIDISDVTILVDQVLQKTDAEAIMVKDGHISFIGQNAIPYITLSCSSLQTLKIKHEVETLEYSVGEADWEPLGANVISFGENLGDIRLRAKNSKGTSYYNNNYVEMNPIIFGNSNKVECKGDIRTLIDYENYAKVYTGDASFDGLFQSCSQLLSAPELPSMVLSASAYREMFEGCKSLVKAPKLPAKVLASACYSCMFNGCSSLSEVPEISAERLALSCCYQMFSYCTSLQKVPTINAKYMAERCYYYMFWHCTSLVEAPQLPAKQLAKECYKGLFSECYSLEKAPELPAEKTASDCYMLMFEKCTSLVRAPVLPAKKLFSNAYAYMFSGCSKLNYVKIDALEIGYQSLTGWLSNVASKGELVKNPSATWEFSSENTPPSGWNAALSLTFSASDLQSLKFSNTNINIEYSHDGINWKAIGSSTITFGGTRGDLLIRGKSKYGTNGGSFSFENNTKVSCSGDIRALVDYDNYYNVDCSNAHFEKLFSGCYQLIHAPELNIYSLCGNAYSYMFQYCRSLTEAPELPASELSVGSYYYMFDGCSSLTKAPDILADRCPDKCCYGMFNKCTSLVQAPQLSATYLGDECYRGMFDGCTSLAIAPELPAEILSSSCYNGMFEGCTSLVKAPELPAKTLSSSCYSYMFWGCTSLTEAPLLLADRLVGGCYKGMFAYCSGLKYIKMMATNIDANICLDNWTNGISNNGTFIKSSKALWDNDNVVPEGWTIQILDK